MDAFRALAEPQRRKVVEILAHRGKLNASQICQEFDVTPQAISQHLRVLREAKVLRMEKSAQRRIYSFDPRSVLQIQTWTANVARQWSGRQDRLNTVLKEEEEE